MKGLFAGIALIVIIGVGGFIYKNAIEHPKRPVACPLDAKLCPDGTSVARTGLSCTFSECLPPNVTLRDISISFALPENFVPTEFSGVAAVAAYELPNSVSSTSLASIVVRRFAISASSTALATIQETAIGSPSDLPVKPTSFSSTILGTHRFTVVSIERFEGVVDTAYYLARASDVLRFDAIDREVNNWTDPNLDPSALPARVALEKLLVTLQGE